MQIQGGTMHFPWCGIGNQQTTHFHCVEPQF